jgi:poly(beta-D-mannuronate) lyase
VWDTVDASTDDGNVPENTIDEDFGTRWSGQGSGALIRYELEASGTVSEVDIAWHQGDQRVFTFDIETSANGVSWTRVYSGQSSGTTLSLETYDVTDTTASWVRIVGYGNTTNNWNSILEVEIWGSGGCGSSGELSSLPSGIRNS